MTVYLRHHQHFQCRIGGVVTIRHPVQTSRPTQSIPSNLGTCLLPFQNQSLLYSQSLVISIFHVVTFEIHQLLHASVVCLLLWVAEQSFNVCIYTICFSTQKFGGFQRFQVLWQYKSSFCAYLHSSFPVKICFLT